MDEFKCVYIYQECCGEKKIQHIESIVKRSLFIYQYYVEIEHKTQ